MVLCRQGGREEDSYEPSLAPSSIIIAAGWAEVIVLGANLAQVRGEDAVLDMQVLSHSTDGCFHDLCAWNNYAMSLPQPLLMRWVAVITQGSTVSPSVFAALLTHSGSVLQLRARWPDGIDSCRPFKVSLRPAEEDAAVVWAFTEDVSLCGHPPGWPDCSCNSWTHYLMFLEEKKLSHCWRSRLTEP